MRIVLALTLLPALACAQTPPPTGSDAPKPVSSRSVTMSVQQSSIDRLAQTNADLLDLLKKQQAVLEDIQFDRRLQSRQIQSLEERLQETLLENAQLQNKIDKLSTAAANPAAAAAIAPAPPPVGNNSAAANQPAPNSTPAVPPTPDKPSSFLAAAPLEVASSNAPGWHRLFTIAGNDSRTTDMFQIQGRQWRVLWHNQDPDGKAYKNTSALFLNAFPKDDTIPQKVCSKLGSGGDITQLVGPGNYYLKIEASGGSWELAVEDFH